MRATLNVDRIGKLNWESGPEVSIEEGDKRNKTDSMERTVWTTRDQRA